MWYVRARVAIAALALLSSGCALRLNNPSELNRTPGGSVETGLQTRFDANSEGGGYAPQSTASFRIERAALGGNFRKTRVSTASFTVIGGVHASQ